MGGKTLDQFNSRQQARARKIKETQSPSPQTRDEKRADTNTPPLTIK